MEGYSGSAPESSDDDEHESSSSSKERAPIVSLGEVIFSGQKAEAETTKQSFFAELVGEKRPEDSEEDDDESDDEAEPTMPAVVEATEPVAAEADELEAPLHSLSEAEKQAVVQDYIEQRAVELRIEHEDAEASDEASTTANELFIEHVDEQLVADPEKSVESALDDAAEATEQDVDASIETANDGTSATSSEAAPEADEDEDEDPAAGTTATSSTQGTTSSATSSSSARRSTPTPTPTPAPTPGPGTPPPPTVPPAPTVYGGPPSAQPGNPTFNRYMAPRNRNTITQADIDAARRHGETSGLVVGGILGYLIGRRRGRIKTEKKLLPIQDKLEQQVGDLQQSVANKEREIRGLAADKFNALADNQREAALQQLQARPVVVRQPAAAENISPAPANFSSELQRLIPEDRPNTQAPAESRPTRPIIEAVPPSFRSLETPPPPREHIENIERLSRKEILEMSERVIIAGTRLRDIYETKLVTELGLRHILTEFLSGGDIQRALDQEMRVKQLTYERDPKIRDQLSASYGSSTGSAGSTDDRNAQPAAGSQAGSNTPMTAPGPSSSSADDSSSRKTTAGNKTEKVMVAGWVTLTLILVIVIFVLLGRRS